MAVYRTQPECPYCGEKIEGIHSDQKDHKLVGDNFIGWDWEGHNKYCANKTLFDAVYKQTEKLFKEEWISFNEKLDRLNISVLPEGRFFKGGKEITREEYLKLIEDE